MARLVHVCVRALVAALTVLAALPAALAVPASAADVNLRARGLRVADFLLTLQRPSGAIPDAPGSRRVNEDSNMEYALIGLGAAYAETGDERYLDGLERGIRWLADREQMTNPTWRGSWYYVYSANAPFDPIATSPGAGIKDVRGVDATSALFAYLVWLYTDLSGDSTLATELEPNVRAALDFVIAKNRSADGFFSSSWQLRDGAWKLWRFRYAADQGDVYLGMRAGGLLYGDSTYADVADFLEQNVPDAFLLSGPGRYALGTSPDGTRDTSMEGFNGIFPQGYLPWMFGPSRASRAAQRWLDERAHRDGSLTVRHGPDFALSAAVRAMGRRGAGDHKPVRSLQWLATQPFGPADGGVTDTGARGPKYANVSGFSVVALLGFVPFDS